MYKLIVATIIFQLTISDLANAEYLIPTDGLSGEIAELIHDSNEFRRDWRKTLQEFENRHEVLSEEEKPPEPVYISFSFDGSSIDKDLVNFYKYLIETKVDLLRPTLIDREFIKKNCQKGEVVCATDGLSMLANGKLAHIVPDNLEKDVLRPLRNYVNKSRSGSEIIKEGIIPGIKLVPFNSLKKISNYEKISHKTICKAYRFDGNDSCVLFENRDYLVLRSQGLRVTLPIDKSEAKIFVDNYLSLIKYTEGYNLGNVNILGLTLPERDNIKSDINGMNESVCGLNIVNEEFDLDEHYKRYYELSGFEHENSNKIKAFMGFDFNEYNYPIIYIMDKLGRGTQNGEEIKYNYKLEDLEFDSVNDKSCDEILNDPKFHARFIVSQIISPKDKHGPSGLLPHYPKENIAIFNALDANKFAELLSEYSFPKEQIKQEDGKSIDRMVINASFHFNTPEIGSTTIGNILALLPDYILLVTSAGQQKLKGKEGEILSSNNCNYEPACFGDLPNVITVGALDTSDVVKVWEKSHRGGEKVTVAAPGKGILIRELNSNFRTGNTLFSGNGTSYAVPFVTALASEIWSLYPKLTASQVRNKIISSSGPIQDGDNKPRVINGKESDIAGGIIRRDYALASIENSIVIYEDGTIFSGKVNVNNKQSKFGFQLSKISTLMRKDNTSICESMSNILRIHRDEYNSNYFYVVCSVGNGKLDFSEGYLKVEGGMPCAFNNNCFYSRDDENFRSGIDLSKVKDIFFSVH